MENHGANYLKRWAEVRDSGHESIWSEEEPEFHGEFVNFDPIGHIPNPCKREVLLFGLAQTQNGSLIDRRIWRRLDAHRRFGLRQYGQIKCSF